MYEEPQSGFSFDSALEIWRRRKWLAIVIFLAVFSAVVTIVQFLPDVYRSSATVLIERQQIPDELVRSTVTSALETRLNTITQEILSRSRLEGLIERFGLYGELRSTTPIEVVMDRMRKDIRVELRSGDGRREAATVAFTVSYTGSDPQKVASVTNTLASFYIEENLKVREEQASGTSQFLSAQLEQMKKDLEAQEKRVSDYKTRFLGQLPHQQEGNLMALEQLNETLRLNADKQIRAGERGAALQKELAEIEANRKGPDTTAGRIAELREELRKLRKEYSDQYPDVIRVKAEITDLVEQLRLASPDSVAGAADNGPDARTLQLKNAIADATSELKALKAEEQRLRGTSGSYQSKVENAPLREQEYQVLMRDYDTTKDLYNSLLQRQKEAELAESMEQRQKGEQFRVIDPAFPSQQPTAPNRERLILIGFALSLGLAVGAVLLSEQINTSFHTLDALRTSVQVPVLVSIPQIVTPGDRRRKTLRFSVATVSVLVGLVIIVGSSYYVAAGNERLVQMLPK